MSRFALRSGSSPRVRGAVIRLSAELRPHGIIPARAGSRGRACETTTWRRDHPRACGEQGQSQPSDPRSEGSSPRVRGAVSICPDWRTRVGIIPARAGSSCPRGRSRASRRDHPRAYGEQLVPHEPMKPSMGSSPRVRGAVQGLRQAKLHHGIIPARAGSSS